MQKVSLTLLIGAAALGFGCNRGEQHADASPVAPPIRLAAIAGNHPTTLALASQLGTSAPHLAPLIVQVPSSLGALESIHFGEADCALTSADITYWAFQGQSESAHGPLDQLRGIAVLQSMPIHLLVRPGLDIHDISDLAGRRVAIGLKNGSTQVIARVVLQAFGVARGSIHEVFLRFDEAGRRLLRGDIDAMFAGTFGPAESVAFAIGGGARLLAIEGDVVDDLQRVHPFLKVAVLREGLYEGQTEAVHTVAFDALFVCNRDLDEEVAYDLTGHFFHILPELTVAQGSLATTDIKNAAATPIPLHSGAARFYREEGLSR